MMLGVGRVRGLGLTMSSEVGLAQSVCIHWLASLTPTVETSWWYVFTVSESSLLCMTHSWLTGCVCQMKSEAIYLPFGAADFETAQLPNSLTI